MTPNRPQSDFETAPIATQPYPATISTALELSGVSKSFGMTCALDDVSFRVVSGQIHGLVGENGAGKSTLMAIASGALTPDFGKVEIEGIALAEAEPARARDLGLAIVRQEPALIPDLTVAENFLLALANVRPLEGSFSEWVSDQLKSFVGSRTITPNTPIRELTPDGRFVVEIARAFAAKPSVLILDEPTEHLGSEEVDVLFERLRAAADRGTAIVYISHRIREVMEIADTITVLRDGRVSGATAPHSTSETALVNMIVGRPMNSIFPPKISGLGTPCTRLEVDGLFSRWFTDITFSVSAGEIVGLAGIEGNGQREVLRALAGLLHARGTVRVAGKPVQIGSTSTSVSNGVAYVPRDRRREGIFPSMSVTENITVQSLPTVSRGPFLSSSREALSVSRWVKSLRIKTPSPLAPIDGLSGGNQQKAILARALAMKSPVILADEPSQGVDIGARSEIYRILRDATIEHAAACVVVSSDAAELAGLCDRVLVFSRGTIIAELSADQVTERAITEAGLTSAASRQNQTAGSQKGVIRRISRSDLSPAWTVAALCLLLGAFAALTDPAYLSERNISGLLTLAACLGAVAIGQQLVMLAGGIDLSVGPLMGLLVVVASFTLAPGTSQFVNISGWILFVFCAFGVGLMNWLLIGPGQVSPLIATLVTFTALQGLSLLLRPVPGGQIARPITDALALKVGVVPVATIAVVICAVTLDYGLRRRRWGVLLRAYGSEANTATKIGVHARPVLLAAYTGAALLAAIGAVLLLPQVGAGDPASGNQFTLLSISAAVLGGAKLTGGRGSFIGALLGALLILQINTVITFMQIDAYIQQYFLGFLTLIAVGAYSSLRTRSETGGSHAH